MVLLRAPLMTASTVLHLHSSQTSNWQRRRLCVILFFFCDAVTAIVNVETKRDIVEMKIKVTLCRRHFRLQFSAVARRFCDASILTLYILRTYYWGFLGSSQVLRA
jgi:hypothetical protein